MRQPALVLIVDDEPDNRDLFEIILSREGLSVVTADGGTAALALAQAHPPDLVVLDIMMPDMDGYQVATALRGNAATARVSILMVTALDIDTVRQRARSAGADDVMTKPTDRVTLCQHVWDLLHRAPQRAA